MGFSSVLYDVVDHCHTEAPEVASWSDDGLHFIIKDPNAFVKKTEKEIKYPSFVRQLNNYGFKNMTQDINSKLEKERRCVIKEVDYFVHDKFRKGQKDLCKSITLKKTNKRQANLKETEEPIKKKKIAEQEEENTRLANENKRLKEELEEYKKQSKAERASEAVYAPQAKSATVTETTDASLLGLASVAAAMPEYQGQPQPFTVTKTTNLNPLQSNPPLREYEYNSPPPLVQQTVGVPPPFSTLPQAPQPHSYPHTVETHSRSQQDYQSSHLNQPPQKLAQPPDYNKLLVEIKRLNERMNDMETKNKDMANQNRNMRMQIMNMEIKISNLSLFYRNNKF